LDTQRGRKPLNRPLTRGIHGGGAPSGRNPHPRLVGHTRSVGGGSRGKAGTWEKKIRPPGTCARWRVPPGPEKKHMGPPEKNSAVQELGGSEGGRCRPPPEAPEQHIHTARHKDKSGKKNIYIYTRSEKLT
ncbi:Hypothetical predicted protein, partial [Pelobates cultripes]